MLNFLLRWEGDHPLCGKVREQVQAAVAAAWEHSDPDDGLAAFWNRLGQEQPQPGPLDGKTRAQVEGAFVESGIATGWDACLGVEDLSVEEAQAKYEEAKAEGIREFWKALGQEQPELERDKRIAELEGLCHEAMHCAKCAAAITGQDVLDLNALEAFKESQIFKGERDAAIARAEKAEAEVERLKPQNVLCPAEEAGPYIMDAISAAGRTIRLERELKEAQAEVERLKPPLAESLEASARWLEEKATPSKQADAERKGTEQGYLRAETIEHIRILLAGMRGLQGEVPRLKAREVTEEDVAAILRGAQLSRFDHQQAGLAKFREIMAAKGGEARP